MDADIERTIRNFREIFYKGIPIMLRQNETALLAFMCMMAATDALAAYRYEHDKVGKRFEDFIAEYCPPAYAQYAANLYLFRCRLLHNFSPAHFTLTHANPAEHLQPSKIGDTILNDETFFADLRTASEKYFGDVAAKPELQARMLARISDMKKGGAIFF